MIQVDSSMRLHIPPGAQWNQAQFFAFCQANRDYRIERTAEGDIEIMPPTGGETGNKNARLIRMMGNWADADGTGEVFDSSTGFELPNGATLSPDVSWVRYERLAALSEEEQEKFLPLAPDFVIELASPSDKLSKLQKKMQEYMDNGVRLGWLILPKKRQVYVYRPGTEPVCLQAPQTISGESVLVGFELDMTRIWRKMFL